MADFYLKCEEQFDKNVWEYKEINRFVWYQIDKLAGLNLGKIITIDKDGLLDVNWDTVLLSDEQKEYLSRLINNERNGVYRNHKFEDLIERVKSPEEYNEWLENKAMNSFMHTVPTKEIFYNFPPDYLKKLCETHCCDELNTETTSGYSIINTLYALDIINPFLVGLILGWKIDIEEYGSSTYIKFNYNGKCLYAKRNSIELFEKRENGSFIKLNDTIHTLLFKHYREPIYRVLNSMLDSIGGNMIISPECLFSNPQIPMLASDTRDVLNSENYKMLVRKYRLNHSRIVR